MKTGRSTFSQLLRLCALCLFVSVSAFAHEGLFGFLFKKKEDPAQARIRASQTEELQKRLFSFLDVSMNRIACDNEEGLRNAGEISDKLWFELSEDLQKLMIDWNAIKPSGSWNNAKRLLSSSEMRVVIDQFLHEKLPNISRRQLRDMSDALVGYVDYANVKIADRMIPSRTRMSESEISHAFDRINSNDPNKDASLVSVRSLYSGIGRRLYFIHNASKGLIEDRNKIFRVPAYEKISCVSEEIHKKKSIKKKIVEAKVKMPAVESEREAFERKLKSSPVPLSEPVSAKVVPATVAQSAEIPKPKVISKPSTAPKTIEAKPPAPVQKNQIMPSYPARQEGMPGMDDNSRPHLSDELRAEAEAFVKNLKDYDRRERDILYMLGGSDEKPDLKLNGLKKADIEKQINALMSLLNDRQYLQKEFKNLPKTLPPVLHNDKLMKRENEAIEQLKIALKKTSE